MEKIWQNLWKRKKKKVRIDELDEKEDVKEVGNADSDKENIEEEAKDDKDDVKKASDTTGPQRVLVTSSGGSETFPRASLPPRSPQGSRWSTRRDPVSASAASLGPSRSVPYEKRTWDRSQHFHIPYGQVRRSSSRTGLSMAYSSRSLVSGEKRRDTTLRRAVEPGDRYKSSSSIQHFHIPSPAPRVVYSRPGTRTAMGKLVEQFGNSTPRARSPSMNNEEPIQLAHYPGGIPAQMRIEREDFAAPPFAFADQERKRRHSGSVMEEEEEELKEEESMELVEEEKRKRNEEELKKISSGIGKVFLDTIRKTEKIRSSRGTTMDPRSAARTPSANRMPNHRLRYDSPAWASPSRDTLHARPWDSVEDLACPVVLTSSGCASGCNSDHYPAAAMASLGPHIQARSTSTLASGTLHRAITPPKPGYTQARASTLPHIRSVSGRIIDNELEMMAVDEQADGDEGPVVSNHSGVVTTVNNSFSWATLARYQTDEVERRPGKSSYFKRPELKHSRTILDLN